MDYANYEGLGKRIKEYRVVAGKSQAQLSEKINLSATYMSLIESGTRKPSLQTIISIANVLNVTVDSLLRDSMDKGKDTTMEELERLLQGVSRKKMEFIYRTIKFLLDNTDEDSIK